MLRTPPGNEYEASSAHASPSPPPPPLLLPPAAPAAPAAPAVATSHLLAVGFDGDQLDRILYGGAPLVKTRADGKLVCRVSARMFPDRAALRKHVAKSKLYRAAYEKACREGRISLA